MNPEYSRVVYLGQDASDIATYKKLPLPPTILGAETSLTGAGAVGAGDVLIKAYCSDALGLAVWPAGLWTFKLFGKVSSATDITQIKVKVYQRDSAGTETLLLTETSAEINNTTAAAITITHTLVTPTTTAATDRLVVKIYHLTDSASSKTTTLYLAGEVNQSRVIAPFGIPIGNADMFKLVYDPDGNGILIAGHTIQDEGSALAFRPTLNFTGPGVTATDNAGTGATDVTIALTNNMFIDQSGGTGDTYGVLAGARNGVNVEFTAAQGTYVSGTATLYLNGQLLTQGSAEDWHEAVPASGTVHFAVAPAATDEITMVYGFLGVGISGGDVYGAASVTDNDQVLFDGDGYHLKSGGAVPIPAMAKLSETLLVSGAANIDITGISGSYRHLKLVLQCRSATAGTKSVAIKLNNDSGANYYHERLAVSGAGAVSGSETLGQTSGIIGYMPGSDCTAGFSTSMVIDIPNYAGTAFVKGLVSTGEMGVSTAATYTYVGVDGVWWNSTAAINRITLIPSTGNFEVGTILSIYGLT